MTAIEITTAQDALKDRLTRAAIEIELIESCMGNTLPKEATKLRSLSAVLKGASERLQALMTSEKAYDRATFLSLAQERLQVMKVERARQMRAKRLRREQMAAERALFLSELQGIKAHAA